jgi:hypothetical protein
MLVKAKMDYSVYFFGCVDAVLCYTLNTSYLMHDWWSKIFTIKLSHRAVFYLGPSKICYSTRTTPRRPSGGAHQSAEPRAVVLDADRRPPATGGSTDAW